MDDYYDEEDYRVFSPVEEDDVIGLTRSTSYSVLKGQELEEIEDLRNILIKEASDFTCLNRDEAVLVLIYFKWNVENLKDMFYDSSEKYLFEAGVNQSNNSLSCLLKKGILGDYNDCSICASSYSTDSPLFS